MLIKIQKRNCLELINIDKKPPSCIDCEYMKHDKEYWCRAKGISSAFSLITGKQIGIVNSCQSQRGGQGKYYCGIEGKFFKKKTMKK